MEKRKSLYSFKIPAQKAKKLKEHLLDRGYIYKEIAHTEWAYSGESVNVTYYTSGALVIAGKGAKDLVDFYLGPELEIHDPKESEEFTSKIGSDESGKGDFFGPLVIASCFVEEKWARELRDLGVQDSKALTDPKILLLAKEIGKRCPCHIVTIMPPRYNELYAEFRNLNHLLAWAHIVAISELVKATGPKKVLVDCFSKGELVAAMAKKKGLDLNIEERVRAEEDLAVAAASCLARAQFVLSLKRLGEKAGITLPKGAGTPVTKALAELRKSKKEAELGQYCKLHFKTLDKGH